MSKGEDYFRQSHFPSEEGRGLYYPDDLTGTNWEVSD